MELAFEKAYEISFYTNEASSFYPVVDHDQPGFPAHSHLPGFLTLNPVLDPAVSPGGLGPVWVNIRTVAGEVPKAHRWAEAETTVLTEFYGSENYGHQIADIAFSLFSIQDMFEMRSRETQFFAFRSCKWNCYMNPYCSRAVHRGEERWEWCAHDLPVLLRALSKRPLHLVSDVVSTDDSPLCFQNLLVGMGGLTFRSDNRHRGAAWQRFRDFFLAGVPVGSVKESATHRPLIVVLARTGLPRRNWANQGSCAEALAGAFPEWEVQILDLRRRAHLTYVHTIHRARVLVTAGGGFAFASVFLPNKACAIYIDSWYDQVQPAVSYRHMNEGRLWDNLGYVRAIYYRRFHDEPGEVISRKSDFNISSSHLVEHAQRCARWVANFK